MAISVETQNLVWQKVKIALQAHDAKPVFTEAFKELKARIQAKAGNIDLEFVPISDLQGDTAVADAACKLYAVYLKKQNTATAAYFKLNDHASSAGGASGANMTDTVELNAASQEALLAFPDGRSQTTGIAVAAETTGAGGSDTSAGDGPDGFVILGRP